MRTVLFLLAFLAIPAFAAQVVWKWVDGDGVTHYSDRAVPGATRMEISGGGERSATSAPTPSFSSAQPAEGSARRTDVSKLRNLEARGWRNFHQYGRRRAGEHSRGTGAAGGARTVSVSRRSAGRGLRTQRHELRAERSAARIPSTDRGYQRSTRYACARGGASRVHGASGIHCESPCWSRAASAAQATLHAAQQTNC